LERKIACATSPKRFEPANFAAALGKRNQRAAAVEA
jgi:hypothetical protein